VAGTAGAERGTGVQRDLPAGAEDLRRVLTETERSAVQPGEIGRPRHPEPHLGKPLGQQLAQQHAVGVELVDEGVEPVLPGAHRGEVGAHGEMTGAVGDHVVDPGEVPGRGRPGHGQRRLQAG